MTDEPEFSCDFCHKPMIHEVDGKTVKDDIATIQIRRRDKTKKRRGMGSWVQFKIHEKPCLENLLPLFSV